MASGETKSPIAKLSWEYRGDGLYIFFANPWLDGQKTDLCMFMWPGHAQEATAEVEKAYEEAAQFICERWNAPDRPSLPEEAAKPTHLEPEPMTPVNCECGHIQHPGVSCSFRLFDGCKCDKSPAFVENDTPGNPMTHWEQAYVKSAALPEEARVPISDEMCEAIQLANLLLDVPYADPDDDLRVLSRQLLRAHERLAAQSVQEKTNGD